MDSSDVHLVVNAGGLHVKRTAENERESQYIVDLVGIVRATGCHNQIIADCVCLLGVDFRIRVGQGEQDGSVRHRLDHGRSNQSGTGNADKDVGMEYGVFQGALARVDSKCLFVFIQMGTSGMNDPLAIDEADIFMMQPQLAEQFHRGDPGGASA
ncbi:MAG TPA: hypothetical protein ENK38_03095 [Gammaproteobacteria bacterium]|nr:hypothetical protein [Gammaproteobacteria bacterium]